MAIETTIYTPRTLGKLITRMPPVHTFFRDTLFKNRRTFPTKSVDVDFKKGSRALAPFVHPKVGGKVVPNSGYQTKTYTPVLLAPDKITTVDDLLNRSAGENPYSGRTPAERAVEKLADDLRELNEMIVRREEWMAATAIFTGQIPIIGEGLNEVIDFDFTNKETIVSAEKKWDADTSDPLDDLERWREAVQKEGFVNCNIPAEDNSTKGPEYGNRRPHLPNHKGSPGSRGNRSLFGDADRMITITAEQIERVNLILSGVPGGIEKALSSTIRRANNTVRSETLKGITTVYAITRQNVRAETTIKVRTQSSDGGIVGTVLFAGHKIPLYRFNVSPTIPIQRATVSAAVLAGNGRTPFQDAFIARMQSGHTGMFERDGSKRLPISEFMGPSTAQMAGNSIVLADVEEKAQEVINKRVEHEITRILNGYGG